MKIANAEDFATVRAAIGRRISERVARTVSDAQAFVASPAYAEAIREIVAKGNALQ